MPARGVPQYSAGILYQNFVAANYIAPLIDLAAYPEAERVFEVRVEAPEHVDDIDDIVVTYADSRTVYIQPKEANQLQAHSAESLR